MRFQTKSRLSILASNLPGRGCPGLRQVHVFTWDMHLPFAYWRKFPQKEIWKPTCPGRTPRMNLVLDALKLASRTQRSESDARPERRLHKNDVARRKGKNYEHPKRKIGAKHDARPIQI